MLAQLKNQEIPFIESVTPADGYKVEDPHIEIIDAMSALLSATLVGPDGSKVIGRAWISDEDGTMAESEPTEIEAGNSVHLKVTIPEAKTLNGTMLACIRVEYPLFDTKHVIHAELS